MKWRSKQLSNMLTLGKFHISTKASQTNVEYPPPYLLHTPNFVQILFPSFSSWLQPLWNLSMRQSNWKSNQSPKKNRGLKNVQRKILEKTAYSNLSLYKHEKTHLSNEQNSGCLGCIRDFTTQICWDYNKP